MSPQRAIVPTALPLSLIPITGTLPLPPYPLGHGDRCAAPPPKRDSVCARARACVCEQERETARAREREKERAKEGKRERAREREREIERERESRSDRPVQRRHRQKHRIRQPPSMIVYLRRFMQR